MNVNVQWDNEAHTIRRYTFSGEWNWNELYASIEQHHASVDQVFSVLVDVRAIAHFPSDAILHLKRAAQITNTFSGMIVIITSSATAVTIYNLFMMFYKPCRDRFQLVTSEAEAYAALGMPA